MSKTIQDYREIVKVLKLQLLKVREENNSLSKTLGITSETQTSSFTPRVEKFRNSKKDFAKHLYLFNIFAHKCQIIGITPQMVFRIADKKRDKKVSVTSLAEIMKRLKLKLDDLEVNKLLSIISKSSSIFYDEFLQYMSAFQINSEKYPPKNQRNYAQLCILKLASQAKAKDIRAQKLYQEVTNGENGPYLSFESFTDFCRKKTNMKDVEIAAVFIALDMQSQCQIDQQNFNREMKKAFNLIERGVSYEIDDTGKRSPQKMNQNPPSDASDNDVKLEEETGVEAGAKKNVKKPEKKPIKEKIVKGDSGKMINDMKKDGIRVNDLISKLLEKEEKRNLVRPFSLLDFSQAMQAITKKIDKKKIMYFFKCLDASNNGSISTDELLKIWLQSSQMAGSTNMYKLLYRHMREIQCAQPITRFETRGYSSEDTLNLKILNDIFSNLNLPEDYIKQIESQLKSKVKVSQFCEQLKGGGAVGSSKKFKAMNNSEYEKMNACIKKLVPKEAKNFNKYVRLKDEGGEEMNKGYWDTIFTNEWSCWDYCLQTVKNLQTFWRDPQFGPSKGDPHGYRSIVGNQSQVPPGMPFEDQIQWLTFEQIQEKHQDSSPVKLFNENLTANDILQGRLGDCWFVSSLSIVAANDEYIKGKTLKQCATQPQNFIYGVHPVLFHCFAPYGLYVFKFYKGFKPIFVVVDDLFPVDSSSSDLIFAKSPDTGLQWVAFVEKAYAKLHHCYSNMISGDISQGLCDITNRLPIKQDLIDEGSDDAEQNTKQLLQKLQQLNDEKQLMGCSISAPKGAGVQQPVELDGERCGLFYGHAYSIGDVIHLKTKDKNEFDLMRVRNPWGHGQWILDWSDQPVDNDPDYCKLDTYLKDIEDYYQKKLELDKKMRRETSEVQKYVRDKNNGEFLMTFQDFSKIFTNLFTGFELNRRYTCNVIKQKWDAKTPSGICKAKGASEKDTIKFVKDNHQYVMDVSAPTDVLMMLIQLDGRLYRGEKYPYKTVCNGINILVFTLENGQKTLEQFDKDKLTVKKLKFELRREVNMWHKFEPGKYAIIPCKIKNDIPESEIQFRVYTDGQVSLKKVRGPSNNFTVLKEETMKNVNQGGITSMLEVLKK